MNEILDTEGRRALFLEAVQITHFMNEPWYLTRVAAIELADHFDRMLQQCDIPRQATQPHAPQADATGEP